MLEFLQGIRVPGLFSRVWGLGFRGVFIWALDLRGLRGAHRGIVEILFLICGVSALLCFGRFGGGFCRYGAFTDVVACSCAVSREHTIWDC